MPFKKDSSLYVLEEALCTIMDKKLLRDSGLIISQMENVLFNFQCCWATKETCKMEDYMAKECSASMAVELVRINGIMDSISRNRCVVFRINL